MTQSPLAEFNVKELTIHLEIISASKEASDEDCSTHIVNKFYNTCLNLNDFSKF